MCGIIGSVIKAQNGFFNGDVKTVEELLYIDALRGPDSTGLACFYNDGQMQLVKQASEAAWFRCEKEYDAVFKKLVSKGKAVIGHNRKKTVGKIDHESAHPFAINFDEKEEPRYLFVHNGTLHNTYTLEKKLPSWVKLVSDVDSEVLGNLICPTNGDKQALEEVLSSVTGAYACVWIDQKQEKLYMVRNKERPLFLAETSVGYFWASEPGFLYAACTRNRIKVDTCEEIKEDCLYTIDLSTHAIALTKEELSLKKAPPVVITATGSKNGRASNKVHTFSTTGKVSKNAFKRFCKKYSGSVSSFTIDDYVERTIGDWKSGWWVWGEETLSMDLPAMCRGVIGPMVESALIMNYGGNEVYGRITSITQCPETGKPIVVMENLAMSRNGVILKERERALH